MSVVPKWRAASVGSTGNSGQVNQFLGTHQAQFLYQGTQRSAQTTGSVTYSDSETQWLSQSFTAATSQSTVGYVLLQLDTVGGSPTLNTIPPLTVSLYADSGGVPTGAALAATTVGDAYIYLSPYWVTVPLPATGLTPGATYHLVTNRVGTATNYYTWHQSNQVSGAATSPDGVTWTSQAFGLMYQVYDQSTSGQVQLIYEDQGAKWTSLTYATGTNLISQIAEYTIGQAGGDSLQSVRTLTYTNGLVTGVS